MSWLLHSKLKALPIHDPKTVSLRSIITYLTNISEPPPGATEPTSTALNKIIGAEIEKYTRPDRFTSVRQTVAYMAGREAQSVEYCWRQQGDSIFLLDRCGLAKTAGVPGVVLEFVIRAGVAAWTVHRIPDPVNLLGHPVYLERNELMAHLQHRRKLGICPKRQSSRGLEPGLVKAVGRATGTLLAWTNPA